MNCRRRRRFGLLLVRREVSGPDGPICICDCQCGRKNHRVLRHNLMSQTSPTTSCGCLSLQLKRVRASKSGDPDRTNDEALALRAKGYSYQQIGDKLSLSRQRIGQIIQRQGGRP